MNTSSDGMVWVRSRGTFGALLAAAILVSTTVMAAPTAPVLAAGEVDVGIDVDGPATVALGGRAEVTVRVSNVGTESATGVTALIDIPSVLELTTPPDCLVDDGMIVCPLGDIASTGEREIPVEIHVDVEAPLGPLSLDVAVVTESVQDPNDLPDEATYELVVVEHDDVDLGVSVVFGESTVAQDRNTGVVARVVNAGTETARNVTVYVSSSSAVDDATPPDCTRNAWAIVCPLGDIESGGERDVGIDFHTFNAPLGAAWIQFAVTTDSVQDPDGLPDQVLHEFTIVEGPGVADVATVFAENDAPVVVGRSSGFQVEVRNLGPAPAIDVLLLLASDAALPIDGVDGGTCDIESDVASCPLGDLAPGEVRLLDLFVTPNEAGTLELWAEAFTSGSIDEVPGNNAASLIVPVQPGLDSLVITPATAVVGTNIAQSFTVEGFNALGTSLGDQTANAVFTISPNGSCTSNACRSGTVGSKVVTATVGTASATATLDVRVRQTITFPTIGSRTMLQSPVLVTATASSGLPVVFSTTTPSVCAAGGDDGSAITLLAPGTCTVKADQPGDATWGPAVPVVRNFTVSQVSQTITFPSLTGTPITGSPVTVAATASSGLAVTFTTTTPTVCDAAGPDGSTIVLLDAGTCTVRAEQPGDAIYRPANPVSRSFTVSKLANTITFPTIGTRTLADTPITVAATASSGLSVTFTTTTPSVCTSGGVDGSTITLLEAGTCTVRAEQPGDAIYRPANPVSRSFTVAKVAQTITFPTIGTRTLADTPVTVAATASSGLAVTFTTTTPSVCTAGGSDGSTITLLEAGTCTVRAEQPGDDYWRAATAVNRNFTVAKVAQTITFPTIGTRTLADTPITVAATASSGLSVSFTTTTPSVCTAGGSDGSSITLLTAGTCTVRAEQAGDDYWRAATGVNRSFAVTPPPPAVSSFTSSVTVLSSAGGAVELSATVEHAATCRFTVSPTLAGFPLTVPCADGRASITATLPVNATANSRNYTFGFAALRSGATTATATPTVVRVAPASEPFADLSVAGSASVGLTRVGEPATYTFTVANAGPSTAQAVDFTALLPWTVDVVSATATHGSGCSLEWDLVRCELGDLASGGSVDVTIVASSYEAGPASITGSVTSAATDVNAANDESTVETRYYVPQIVYTDDQTGAVLRMNPGTFSPPVPLTTQPGAKGEAVVSPNGQMVAYWRQAPVTFASEIWLVGIDGSDERHVATVGVSMAPRVSWSPDSSSIVFSVLIDGKWKAVVASATGSPDPQLLIPDMTYGESSPAFSPDGSKVIFRDSCQRPAPAQCRYHLVDADGSGTPTPYTTYPFGGGVVWDPDGEWFYFANTSGTIYRARVDGSLAEPIVTGTYGGTYWSLSPQGDRIAFTDLVDGKPVISVVDVDGSNRHQLTVAYAAGGSAGCYSPVWTFDQAAILMHCYPGSGAIGIYRVASNLTSPTSPTSIGGSFRSRNVELAGSRPTW